MTNLINTLKYNKISEINLKNVSIPLVLIIIFALNPIVAAFLAIIAYLYDSSNFRIYSLIISFSIGLLAYNMIPQSNFDILRIQSDLAGLSQVKYYGLKSLLMQSPEPARLLFDFFVYNLNDKSLLQFIAVWIGYFLIFYMIGDYSNKNQIRKTSVFITLTYIIIGFAAIYFFSGIYNYLAMILFSYAFYRETYQKKSKVISYFIYLSTPLIHNALALPLLVLFFYKISSEKFRIPTLSALALSMIYITAPLSLFLNKVSFLSLFSQYQAIVLGYLGQPLRTDVLTQYTYSVLALEIFKILISLFLAVLYAKDKGNHKKTSAFIIYLITAITILSLTTPITLRFLLISSLVGIPILLEKINNNIGEKKYGLILALLLVSIAMAVYQQKLFLKVKYPSYFYTNTAISVFNKENNE
jgi:hypothetical protein